MPPYSMPVSATASSIGAKEILRGAQVPAGQSVDVGTRGGEHEAGGVGGLPARLAATTTQFGGLVEADAVFGAEGGGVRERGIDRPTLI